MAFLFTLWMAFAMGPDVRGIQGRDGGDRLPPRDGVSRPSQSGQVHIMDGGSSFPPGR